MNVERIISKITNLPTLPDVAIQLNCLLKSSSSCLDEVSRMIEQDAALSSKVLRLANSSYYGLSSTVDSISRSVIVLGFNTIYNVVTTASVQNVFKSRVANSGIDIAGLWIHTLGCAVASKAILSDNVAESEKAFMCGILHDLGKVVISDAEPEEQKKILSLGKSGAKTMIEAEREVLGTDHAEVGYAIAQKWKFPDFMLDAIRYHHRPQSAKISHHLTAAVHLGNSIAKALALGKSTESKVTFIDPVAWKLVGLTENDMDPLIERVQQEFDMAMELWMTG